MIHTASTWRVLLVIFSCFLGSCATINETRLTITPIDTDRAPPIDFPQLNIVVHEVSHKEMLTVCEGTQTTLACAFTHFGTGTCDIWYSKYAPPTKKVVIHEELHCKGYDHPGESRIRDAWEYYKHNTKDL